MGNWTSISHMEDCLTLEELYLLIESRQKEKHADRKFAAALKGIDLDKEQQEQSQSQFTDIEQRAKAHLAGKSEQEYVLDLIGIEIEDDDDE